MSSDLCLGPHFFFFFFFFLGGGGALSFTDRPKSISEIS